MPSGIDTVALAKAIEAKLRAGGNAGSGRSGGPLSFWNGGRIAGLSCHG